MHVPLLLDPKQKCSLALFAIPLPPLPPPLSPPRPLPQESFKLLLLLLLPFLTCAQALLKTFS